MQSFAASDNFKSQKLKNNMVKHNKEIIKLQKVGESDRDCFASIESDDKSPKIWLIILRDN